MNCDKCDKKARVINSRPHKFGTKRRYICDPCDRLFTTQEVRTPEEAATFDGIAELTPEGLYLWRQQLGLSQSQAADVLGVSRTKLSNMERGLTRVGLPVTLACEYLRERCIL